MSVKLSQNFSLNEATFSQTAVRLGINNEPDDDTLERMEFTAAEMERVRSLLGHPIRVSSWFRCLPLNRAIGSGDTSDHVLGYAIDFTCEKFGTPLEVSKAIAASSLNFGQLIWEGTWVHISFNPKKNREILTAHFAPGKKVRYTIGLPKTT